MLYFIVFFSNVTHCVYILFYLKQIVLENIMFSVKSLWDIKPNFRCSFDIGELIDELSVKWTDYENDVMRREDLKRIHQLVLILSCCKFWILQILYILPTSKLKIYNVTIYLLYQTYYNAQTRYFNKYTY